MTFWSPATYGSCICCEMLRIYAAAAVCVIYSIQSNDLGVYTTGTSGESVIPVDMYNNQQETRKERGMFLCSIRSQLLKQSVCLRVCARAESSGSCGWKVWKCREGGLMKNPEFIITATAQSLTSYQSTNTVLRMTTWPPVPSGWFEISSDPQKVTVTGLNIFVIRIQQSVCLLSTFLQTDIPERRREELQLPKTFRTQFPMMQ